MDDSSKKMRLNYEENSDNRNSLSPKSQLFSIQSITGQTNLTDLSNKQSNNGNNNVAVAAAALIKNLETNKMFASYLNQLKFPFNMNSYPTGNIDLKSQVSSSQSALTAASSPSSSVCTSPVSNVQSSPLLDLSVRKQRNEKLNDATSNVNNIKKMNFFGSVSNILPSVSTSSTSVTVLSNKDALDLTLPNRSRLNESMSHQINNEIQPLIMKSNSTSSTSSISPLSSVSNSSSSDMNNRPTISSLMTNSSKTKVDELKKSKNLKRKKSALNDEEIRCKKESNDTPLALLNRPQQPPNIDSSFQQQQQNILNSILLNAAASQNPTISQPILNSFPNGFLFPNLQHQQQNQPLNPVLFQQYNNNPFMFMNQKQQNETDKSSMNKMLDQLMQYSNYMKLIESYQKNINQTNNLTSLMGSLGNGFPFNPALLSNNNYISVNSSINSSTSNNNTKNSNSIDPSSQPLALSLSNSGL